MRPANGCRAGNARRSSSCWRGSRWGRFGRRLKGLSERQRTVFLLRYVEEQELSEIAQATGLSEGTVKAHLSRALGKVRAELGGKR